MNSSGQDAEAIAVEREQQPAELSSPASLLTFIGSGTVGPIIVALGPRALHTNALTQRLPAYSPRTIYRHSRRLSELGLIEREEAGGVPSSVLQRLSESGRALYRILDSYAKGDDGPETSANGAGTWTACALIGEMWELGWIQALSQHGQSASELTVAASGAEPPPGGQSDATATGLGPPPQKLDSWTGEALSAERSRQARLCADPRPSSLARTTHQGSRRRGPKPARNRRCFAGLPADC